MGGEEVPLGTTDLTATILYDLEAGVVGDTFFDLAVPVNPTPGTGTITLSNVQRSSPCLYESAVNGAGVFNTPAFELAFTTNLLQANQGANDPLTDMMLSANPYLYADISLTLSGPLDSTFDLTFANFGLDDENVLPRSLDAIGATVVIVPEPSSLLLLAAGACLFRFRPSRQQGRQTQPRNRTGRNSPTGPANHT